MHANLRRILFFSCCICEVDHPPCDSDYTGEYGLYGLGFRVVIVTMRDNQGDIRVLTYSYDTTITSWGGPLNAQAAWV